MRSFLDRAVEIAPRLVELRRRLHRHPEIAWNETGTRALIEKEVAALGCSSRGVARTGLLTRLPGASTLPSVVLRAELDALPIEEETGLPFRSESPGVMHACGHDAHMTMIFGAGLLLSELKPELAGRIVLLFQPAEEVPPGGAREVLASGALEQAGASAIFAIHVDPRFPAGQLLLRRGPLMAASDRFRISVVGKGGHGGYPHLTIDPIVVAAQIIVGLQTVVSRQVDPTEPAVVSVGKIAGGTADNVIPAEVTFSGTIRTHSAAVRSEIPQRIERTARGIAEAAGADIRFEYLPGHPGLSNDPAIIDFVEKTVTSVLGAERVIRLDKPIMGGEDFAHYLEKYPGAFLRIGVRNEAKGCVHPIHSPRFNLDEDALAIGAAALAAVAAGWLEQRAGPG